MKEEIIKLICEIVDIPQMKELDESDKRLLEHNSRRIVEIVDNLETELREERNG